MPKSSDNPLILLPGVTPGNTAVPGGTERRRAPRYPFTATAEAIEPRSRAQILGRTSDLGLGGCYFDTLSPFPLGSVVNLRITRDVIKFEALATVVSVHPSMGMGLAFSKIEPEQAAILQGWLAELSGEPLPQPVVVCPKPVEDTPALHPNVRQVLNDLINLMIRKKLISESEGVSLLRELYR